MVKCKSVKYYKILHKNEMMKIDHNKIIKIYPFYKSIIH